MPAGTAEKDVIKATAEDKTVKAQLVECFMKSLDANNDRVVTKDEFLDGLEAALRVVVDKLLLIHFNGNQEAMKAAGYQACFSVKCPGFASGSGVHAHKVAMLKNKTIGEL